MAKVRERILPDTGRRVWLCDYRDGAGRRRFRQFDKRRDADAFLVDARAGVRDGSHVADSQSATVAAAADNWLRQCELEGLEESTTREYKRHVEATIKPALGATRLSRLTRPAVADFRRRLLETRSPAMTTKIMTSLRALIDNAVDDGLAAHNPAANVRKKRTEKKRRRSQPRQKLELAIPNTGELQLMMERVEQAAGARWRPFLIVAAFSGMRASELRALTWNCVDLGRRTITVNKRADFRKRIGAPKSEAGHRQIPVGPFVANTLREWKVRCAPNDRNLVFPTERGGVYGISKIRSLFWLPLLQSCGLMLRNEQVKYRFHDLRHVVASRWIAQGANAKRIQTLLGHSSITQTYDVYGRLLEDAERDRTDAAEIESGVLGWNRSESEIQIAQ